MWQLPAIVIYMNVFPFTFTTLHAVQQQHVAVTSCSPCGSFTTTTLHAV